MNSVTAFAPATVSNVACGFDVLGFALDEPGDEVTASFATAGVSIAAIEAMHADVARSPDLRATTMRLDSLLRVLDYPSTNVGRTSFANLVAARLLEKLGDIRGALAAARRRSDAWAQNNPYLATQLREQGRLAALAGEREEAIRAYRHFLALRADAEPALQPQVEAVRRELKQLEKASAGR